MNTQLKAHLEHSIQTWMDEHNEDNEWPRIITGEETVTLMATAAASVFDALAEAQRHAVAEGFLKEA